MSGTNVTIPIGDLKKKIINRYGFLKLFCNDLYVSTVYVSLFLLFFCHILFLYYVFCLNSFILKAYKNVLHSIQKTKTN